VEGLDLSFDAKRIVFAMKLSPDEAAHIFTANLVRGDDEENPYGIAQLTAGPHDDVSPVWVAGGGIAFITNQAYTEMGTRADEYNHSRSVTQIATISEVGGDADRKLCSQNLSHTFNLFRMKSGQIGFSRWEHLENINDAKLFAMNPDCTQMIALAGQHDKPSNSPAQVAEGAEPNVVYAVATRRENTIQAGALVRVDARSAGRDTLHDEERATYEVLTPAVPRDDAPSPVGRYRSPFVLPDGRLLVSWADGYVNESNEIALTPPDFGIYLYDPETRVNRPVWNDEATWEVYARPVAPTPEPPVQTSVQTSQDATLPLTLGSVDVRQTSLGSLHGNTVSGAQFQDTPIEDALTRAVKVRIIEGFSTEGAPGVTMFGLTMAEGAAILGEATVRADGSWRAEVPPFVPIHLRAVDEFDLAIRNQTTWIRGMPGESRVCGGCHEERTRPSLSAGQALPIAATQVEDFLLPVLARTELPWQATGQYAGAIGPSSTEIQQILDARCVSCHDETTNGNGPQEFYTVAMTDEASGAAVPYRLPRLDLSRRPIEVTYDMRTATYPASYVSIFYPAALEMEMSDGAEVTGTIPPKCGVPSDARNSRLIEKLNVSSSLDGARHAWTLGEPFSDPGIRGGTRTVHPEDVGGSLTREERVALIRAFDLGGQYHARQNSDFQPHTGADPTASGGGDYQR